MANAYLTVAEFATMVDTTLLAKLGADGGSTGTVDQNNTILATSILRASAEIEMNATKGNAYTPDVLLALYNDGDYGVRSLCAQLALHYLYARRGKDFPASIQDAHDQASLMLDELRNGVTVFGVSANRDAGRPGISVINASQRVNLMIETASSPFYPPVQTSVQ